MRKFLIVLALIVAPVVHAAEPVVTLSGQAATMDEFVASVAPALAFRTASTGREFCGVIERDGEGFKVDVYTSRSSTYCKLHNVSEDATTIHTHPAHMYPIFGEGDYATAGYLVRGRTVLHQAGRGTERRVSSR